MSHEVSETVGQPGDWQNISGVTGKPLNPILSIEKQHYASIREAVNAADMRSVVFGRFLNALMRRHRSAQTMDNPNAAALDEAAPMEEPGAFPFRR